MLGVGSMSTNSVAVQSVSSSHTASRAGVHASTSNALFALQLLQGPHVLSLVAVGMAVSNVTPSKHGVVGAQTLRESFGRQEKRVSPRPQDYHLSSAPFNIC